MSNSVFIVDNYVLSTPNADQLSNLPPQHSIDCDTNPAMLKQLHWASNKFLQLGFIPSSVQWDNPILQRFAYQFSTFPIERDGINFRLSTNVAEKWSRFEGALTFMIHLLLKESSAAWFPLEVEEYPHPSKFGYLRLHKLESWARKCAMKSRDAFLPLMAMCSFAISFHLPTVDSPLAADPPWVSILVNIGKVHPEWAGQLKSSFIGDFSVDRVGVLVDPQTCQWNSHILQMRNAKVPLWFVWGTKDKWQNPSPQLQVFYPTSAEVSAALQIHTEQASRPKLPPPNEAKFPLPRPDSRQKYGETWQEFFDREAVRHAKTAKAETATERASRLACQKESERFICPRQGGPAVYRWEDENGFLLRTRVFRKELDDFWYYTPHEHMRYNSFDREWDICQDFVPTLPTIIDDGSSDDWSSGEQPYEQDHSHTFTSLAQPAEETWRHDLFSVYGQGDSHELENIDHQSTRTLVQTLYERYGFQLDAFAVQDKAVPLAGEWKKDATMILQDSSSPVDEFYKRPIITFLQKLLSPTYSQEALSWDLSFSSSSTLRQMLGRSVEIVKFMVQQQESNTTYVIRPTLQHIVRWELAVGRPSSALLCVRLLSHLNMDDLVRHLLKFGIPFCTLVPRSSFTGGDRSSRMPPQSRPFVGLGTRCPGYEPDTVDYAAYEAARDSFFARSYARAALQRGGIIWRLALEYLNPGVVLIGPSDVAPTQGLVFHSPDGVDYVDDGLTDDEIDLICGVYHVYTGKGDQISHMSWWPKPTTWAKTPCGNAGYWTPAAEEWFLKRLSDIRANRVTAKIAAKWRDYLPRNSNAITLTSRIEDASTRFIDGHDFP